MVVCGSWRADRFTGAGGAGEMAALDGDRLPPGHMDRTIVCRILCAANAVFQTSKKRNAPICQFWYSDQFCFCCTDGLWCQSGRIWRRRTAARYELGRFFSIGCVAGADLADKRPVSYLLAELSDPRILFCAKKGGPPMRPWGCGVFYLCAPAPQKKVWCGL